MRALREALRRTEQRLALEVEAAQQLQQVATQLVNAQGTGALFEQILDTAQSLLRADFANIQMFYPERGAKGELLLLGHRGFSPEAVKRWQWVSPSALTTCGEALRTGRRVMVSDVRNCEFMAESEVLEEYLAAGIFAAHSLPLTSRSGQLLGMVTTYWREPHELSVTESRSLDILARLAADLIERSQVEEARWENQRYLESIYDTVRDVIFHLAVEDKEQFRFVSVNPAFLRVTGLSRENVVGKTVNEVIPESSLTMVLSKYRQAIEERTTVLWEETSDYPTGRLSGEVSIAPVFDDKGTCTHLVGSVHDITERKQAEVALRESEERFRNMANTAPVMIWVTGPDKLFTFVNTTWLAFTGRTIGQELGNGWAASVHPDDWQRCYDAFCWAFDARRNFQVECRLRRWDGEYRSVLCSGIPRSVSGDVFGGYIGSVIDITDLQSEERFRQLADNIDQVFWMFDIRSRQLLYVSPVFEKVWGLSPTVILKNPERLAESVHAEDRNRFMTFLAKSESAPAEEFYRIIRPDGSTRWIHQRTFPIFDGNEPYRIAAIAEDVTAQQELEEQLRQSQKMEALGRLAGGIAHDFNNVLTVICGYSKMLLDRSAVIGPNRHKLEHILSAGNLASILTRQLLAFSRRQVREPKIVNINHLLTNLGGLLRPLIGEHIVLEMACDPGLSCINVDPHQIEQVIMNLAANAKDAMPDGGRFQIETKMADSPTIPTSHAEGAGDWVRLRISDTGCGMDDRTRERAFEPFFTTKGVGKGTGLGLSTVYGIVQQNQGHIHISSAPGRGTTFDLWFPAVLEGGIESEVLPQRETRTRAHQTILVVEDQPSVRGLIRETLEQLGYAVVDAADGHEALRMMEQETRQIQLLVTDVIMPVMNGRELATRLRSIRPELKVLYMSGYTDEVLAFHGMDHPEICFIQKPFTNPELAAKVELALAGGR